MSTVETLRPSDRMVRLITVAPGGREEWANETALALTSRAARTLGLPVVPASLEHAEPLLADVVAADGGPAVVVPLLLSTGRIVRREIPRALSASRSPLWLTPSLGPHPLVAEVMGRRLAAAGARRGDPVVLIADTGDEVVPLTASGGEPPADLALAGRLLAARWGAPVLVATVGGAGRSPAEAIAEARTLGRPAVAPYVLSPGPAARRITTLARALRVPVVADVIGAHPLVADLVVRRYHGLLAAMRPAA